MSRIQTNKVRHIPTGIHATSKTNFLTPPPTVEHQERHWHTGDTDMDDSDLDESKREHSDYTDVEGTDLGKTEREKPDDTDVKESDSGDKDPYEDEDSDHHITIIPRNDPQNSYEIGSLIRRTLSETTTETDLIEM